MTTVSITQEIKEYWTLMLVEIIVGLVLGYMISKFIHHLFLTIKGEKKGNDEFNVVIFSDLIKAEDLAFINDDKKIASLQIIGRGGCGDVYKIDLDDSTESRIKSLVLKNIREDIEASERNIKQMRAEIQTVGHIRHPNLLPLLAHASRKGCHYLVFEFMKNGSLQTIMSEVRDGKRELDWLQRHKIALGVAAGLEYIHQSQSPCILHRDLKPDNVLLDDKLQARITDFGLSTKMTNTHTHMSFSNAAGTVGYMAPEYFDTRKYTYRCDMFSFGVILAVLVTGKFPSDEMHFPDWIKDAAISNDPRTVIDKKLIGNGYEEQMIKAIKIACLCASYNSKHRPDARCVRELLEKI